MDRAKLFAGLRSALFGGKLTQGQVDGITAILDAWQASQMTDLRWLAYMLATAYHETARTMQPIAEYGKGKGRKYGVKGKHGQVPYGRGYVQLTWDVNYEKADQELGLGGALLNNFDLALDQDLAAKIMFLGMEEGWFTGKKLGDYFDGENADWLNARRIINGMDRAKDIAAYGRKFHSLLLEGVA